MSKRFLSGINVTGSAALNTVADAGSNTDKFLVLDSSNVVSYRTASELYADLGIGSLPAGYTSTLKHEVKAGQTISKGQAVYVSSADGTNMIVTKASNVSEATSSKTMGLLETSLTTNGKGNVITEGLLSGLNTNGATAGDPVWLGVDGALIFGLTNKPYAPAHLVFIGIVTRANANNGEIFVKVQNGFEMNELHNYQQGSVQNNEVIVYESATSLYKPKSIPTILGYTPVPDSRTLTINGTTYDLTANRAWTITTDASARSILRYVATANQTTFTISGGYTPGLTDVYRNGVKLDNSTDFTATNGTTIVLTNGASVNDVIEVYRYQTAFLANNALRQIYEFVATAGQTTFLANYNTGMVDVFYNGSKLVSTEYTAGNGTSIILGFACNLNDTIEIHAYSYQVGAFVGQSQLNGTGFVKANGTTITYDNSTYLTSINSSQVITALGYTPYNSTNPSGYITSSALSSYLPLSGGTLTGATTISISSNSVLDIFTLYNSSQTSAGVRQRFRNGYGDLAAISVSQRDNGALADDGQMHFQVASNSVLDTKMTILNNGNIGVATTSPLSKFHVNGTMQIGYVDSLNNAMEFYWNGASSYGRIQTYSSSSLALNPLGNNVGIGTLSPYALLTIYSGSAGDRILIDSANGSGSNGAIAWGAGGVPNISARIRGIDDGFYGTHLLFETRGQSGPATNTIERVRISSGGIVTRPYQPFVIGGLDGNQSISSNTFTTLNFSTSVGMFYYANVGNCWNNSTRAFTAPVTGVYMVNVSLMTDSVGQVALHVNGARRHSIPAPPFTSGITWGGTAMIPLTAGESLTLQGYGNAGSVTQNQFHTFFSIYLL
jgi:hypothetical protein